MKKINFLTGIIVILVIIIISMSIKMFMMSRDYKEQKNTLKQTEKQVTLIKEQIKERCPDEFNFVD